MLYLFFSSGNALIAAVIAALAFRHGCPLEDNLNQPAR